MKLLAKLKIVFAFALLLATATTYAQPKSLGLDMKTERVQYLKVSRIDPNTGSKADDLPMMYSLKEYCPPVLNQGVIGSCVGWSVGYEALTMSYAIQNEWSKSEVAANAFSPLFLYNNIYLYQDCANGGASLYEAGRFMKSTGNCKKKDFDIDVNDCHKQPDAATVDKAKKYKIKDYYSIFEQEEKVKTKIYLVKKNIAAGYPVAVGMNVNKNIAHPEGKYWRPDEGDSTPWGGHAMVVVGYDDGKHAFELMNSWGKDWGNDGFIWVKYEDFAEHCMMAYIYILDEDVNPVEDDDKPVDIDVKKEVALTGKFAIRMPFRDEEKEEIGFKEIKPEYKSGYTYELTKKDWEIGDQFQLVVKGVIKKKYVYVFSYDNEGVNIHWPRSARKDKKVSTDPSKMSFGAGESSIIAYKNVKIVIPGENRVLVKRAEGTDNIIILYSNESIDDFHDRLDKFEATDGDVQDKFAASFKDLAIPADDVNYSKNKMKFETKSKNGILTPIFVTVE